MGSQRIAFGTQSGIAFGVPFGIAFGTQSGIAFGVPLLGGA
jgi:hypothetical protein